MIARVWRGRTRAARADVYYDYLVKTGAEECRQVDGNAGVEILRRVDGDTAEFVFVSYWQSMDDVRRFAGPEMERAVYYPEDRTYLLELEPHVLHYEVMAAGGGRAPALDRPGGAS